MAFKRLLKNRISLILFVVLTIPTLGWSADQCRQLFALTTPATVEKVFIPEKVYNDEVLHLRATLSGKLATVWRSEWKTKLAVSESNEYVLNLVKEFLSLETQLLVLNGLNIRSGGFAREVHARLYDMQLKKLLQPHDELAVRDPPAPQGARDTTFTFYTKPISSSQGDGKHQARVRGYLREVKPSKIQIGKSVQGYDMNGRVVTIERVDQTTIKITKEFNKVIETTDQFTLEQAFEKFGSSIHLFAMHGKNFKLEIKTALNDEIAGLNAPRLAGKHMVQKLDVSLTIAQVSKLFGPLKGTTDKEKYLESASRVNDMIHELTAQNPENKPRIDAVFEVILEGLRNNEFLTIEGATWYHRTAFETNSGLQTTIDRDQGIFLGNMYGKDSLKSPFSVIKNNELIKTKVGDARHVELKVPVTSMENTVGIVFDDPTNAPKPQNANFDSRIKVMIGIYHGFVRNAFHSGKFNYIRKNGDLGD